MNGIEFIKEKTITIALLFFSLVTIEIFLMIYQLDGMIKLYIPIVIVLAYSIGVAIEYYTKNKYYTQTFQNLEELDKKYLLAEVIEPPHFIEGKLLKTILEQTDKAMVEHVNEYKYVLEEYKEYIELWIHEIKLPIATAKLTIENNKNEITKSIDEEMDKIDDYVEQALYYARASNVEKDYLIKKVDLEELIKDSIVKNRKLLRAKNIKIETQDLDKEVYTDSKWILFILGQILQNSVKYANTENASIVFWAKEEKERVILGIKDNGLGIKQSEIVRVFEKGFTGSNGRMNGKKSTGIGLYLCKKLCTRLGIGIELKSEFEQGTEVLLYFPKGSFTQVQ